jgi:Domain of unknown function (DUF5655)
MYCHIDVTSTAMKPLWRCPECERTFANRNQTHTCARLRTIDDHFTDKDPLARTLFDEFVARLRTIGDFSILPEKTRIAFHVRMSFAQITPRRQHLDGHLVLARRADDPLFRKVETMSPRSHVHHFRLTSAADLSQAFVAFMCEAYEVGCQKHLT